MPPLALCLVALDCRRPFNNRCDAFVVALWEVPRKDARLDVQLQRSLGCGGRPGSLKQQLVAAEVSIPIAAEHDPTKPVATPTI